MLLRVIELLPLQTRRFSTEKTVSELYTLVFKHAEGVSTTPLAVCKAIQKDKDLVVIDFEVSRCFNIVICSQLLSIELTNRVTNWRCEILECVPACARVCV